MKTRTASMIMTFALMAGAAAWAQQPPGGMGGGPGGGMGHMGPQREGGGPRPGGDPMMENFFPPELIMQNQKAIGLKEDEQKAIREEVQKTMARFTDLQWQQSAETETMAALMKADRPDEKKVLAQLDKLMSIENEVKRLQLGMLIRVKNLLTPEQKEKLNNLKSRMMPPPGVGGPRGQGGQPGMGCPVAPGGAGCPQMGEGPQGREGQPARR